MVKPKHNRRSRDFNADTLVETLILVGALIGLWFCLVEIAIRAWTGAWVPLW